MSNEAKLKDFIEIMNDIDAAIVTNPKARKDYIAELDREINKLNDELALEGHERKEIDPDKIMKELGIFSVNFDEHGNVKQVWGKCRAGDFRKR